MRIRLPFSIWGALIFAGWFGYYWVHDMAFWSGWCAAWFLVCVISATVSITKVILRERGTNRQN
jgi:hypothetical protein